MQDTICCPSCHTEFHGLKGKGVHTRSSTVHGYYDSAGDWTTVGCQLASIDPQIICECYHLTNFAILVVSSAQLIIILCTIIIVRSQ